MAVTPAPRRLPAPNGLCNLETGPETFQLVTSSDAFTGANFLLSLSQPNFYFHASTAYAILRAQGVPIGKRDFMGMPRMKA